MRKRQLEVLFQRRSSAVVLLVGLLLAAAVSIVLWQQDQRRATDLLSREAAVVVNTVSEKIGLGVAHLRSLQAFVEASDTVSRVEFSRFAIRQGPSPGMVALGYAPIVATEQLSDFQATAMEDRSFYRVVGIDRRPLPHDADWTHVPVWFSHQHVLLPAILGVDLASDVDRRAAIIESMGASSPVVTGFVDVLGESAGHAMEIYAPIVDASGEPVGVVFATIRIEDLTEYALLHMTRPGTAIRILDVADDGVPSSVQRPDRWVGSAEAGNRLWQIELETNGEGVDVASVFAIPAAIVVIVMLGSVLTAMKGASRQYDEELRHLRRSSQEKDKFLASVAHELRTPLTSVLGMTAMLADGWSDLPSGETEEFLRIAHSEASDLSDLVEDLLTAGRLESRTIHYTSECVDLAQQVNRVAGRLVTPLEVKVHLPGAGPFVNADPLRVRQIVRNVMVNAVRYGSTCVTVECTEGENVSLVTRNDGPPISGDLEAMLFEPYAMGRGEPGRGGSIGLGLHISRTLAQAMAGDLSYRYEDGWCIFELTLPSWSPRPATTDGSVFAPHTRTHTRSSGSVR
ncbi:hypothetical protein BH23ACT5_BH23ACT5_08540 [soil metagenome]